MNLEVLYPSFPVLMFETGDWLGNILAQDLELVRAMCSVAELRASQYNLLLQDIDE